MQTTLNPEFQLFDVIVPERHDRVVPGVTANFLARLYMAVETSVITGAGCIEDLAEMAVHGYLADYLGGDHATGALQTQLPGHGPQVDHSLRTDDNLLRCQIPVWPRISTELGPVRVCLLEIRNGLKDEELARHTQSEANSLVATAEIPGQLAFNQPDSN